MSCPRPQGGNGADGGDRVDRKKTSSPLGSEWRLTEGQNAVSDLVPTQGDDAKEKDSPRHYDGH